MSAKRERRTKVCETCEWVFIEGVHETGKSWAARRFCSVKCAKPRTRVSRSKKCEQCGETFLEPTTYNIGKVEWEKRRFCSDACHRNFGPGPRRDPQSKLCDHCGSTFMEPWPYCATNWTRRRFCNRTCMGVFRKENAKPPVPRPYPQIKWRNAVKTQLAQHLWPSLLARHFGSTF